MRKYFPSNNKDSEIMPYSGFIKFNQTDIVSVIKEETADKLSITSQDLTEEQKAQARQNIGASNISNATASAVTVEPDTQASAEVQYNDQTGVLNFSFNIPKGEKGDSGPSGTPIGAATLYSDKVLITVGSGDQIKAYYPAAVRDEWGRITAIGRAVYRCNCDCNCDCDCNCQD